MPSNGANNLKAAKRIAKTFSNKGYPGVYIIRNYGGKYKYWVETKGRAKKGKKGKIYQV